MTNIMLNLTKKFIIKLLKAIVIMLLILAIPIGYVSYKTNTAENHANHLCDALVADTEITLEQLIKQTIDSDSPPFFVSITTIKGGVSWFHERGWSKKTVNSFDFNATSFSFSADWQGVFLDRWVCIIGVDEGKITSKDIRFLD